MPSSTGLDARTIRLEILRTLTEATGGDFAVFCKVSFFGTESYYGQFFVFGESDALVAPFEGTPTSATFQQAYGPLGVTDQLELLPFVDGRSLGWIGIMRKGRSTPFGEIGKRNADRLLSEVQSALLAAEALERPTWCVPEYALLEGCGALLQTSPLLESWLTPGRARLLSAMVRAAERDRASLVGENARVARVHGMLDGMNLRFVCMEGMPRSQYLAVVSPTALDRKRPVPVLSASQRQVAQLAADGMNVGEIARSLAISPNTVKFHLKNVYELWNVRDRLGLRRMIERAKAP